MTVKDYLFKYRDDGFIALDKAVEFVNDVQFTAKKDRTQLTKKDIRNFSQFRWAAKRMQEICLRIENNEYPRG